MLEVKQIAIGPLGTNCHIITDTDSGETAAVDCALFNEEYQKFLDDNKIGKLKYILLTHGHFDHICGVKGLKERCGGLVCIHEEDDIDLSYINHTLGEIEKSYPHEYCDSDIRVTEDTELSLGEHKIKVMHTPGHTKGSVIYITDGIIFSGDTLFLGSMGRTDLPGGSMKSMFASLIKIGQIEGDYVIYPGHGEKTSLAYEKKFNRFLRSDDFIHR